MRKKIFLGVPNNLRRKISILLVDDNAPMRAYIRNLLKDTEFTLWEAADCPTAMRYLQAPDLAVDMMLSEIVVETPCGWDLAAQVSMLRPQAKVILMSSRYLDALQGHKPYITQGLYLWGVEFLPKPFSRDQLMERLREVWAHGATLRLESATGLGRLGSEGFETTG